MKIKSRVRCKERPLSRWVTLITRSVQIPGIPGFHEFHSFKQADYVTMFAVTANGKIPLVRQYRPALEKFTVELPSGLLDDGEKPVKAASRELFEETGFIAGPKVRSLGCLAPDSGRLENRLWAFFTSGATPDKAAWQPDPQVRCQLVSKRELKQLIVGGEFEHALHLAVVGMAMVRGYFRFN